MRTMYFIYTKHGSNYETTCFVCSVLLHEINLILEENNVLEEGHKQAKHIICGGEEQRLVTYLTSNAYNLLYGKTLLSLTVKKDVGL